MAVCRIVACYFVILVSQSRASIYKEIYPPLSENVSLDFTEYQNQNCTVEKPCPLFFVFLISFGGLYLSNGALPGIQVALDEINSNPNILPQYTLHYTLHDSNCSREVALSAYFTQMFQPPYKVGMIGSGCSVSTEATAEIAHYYNLTQVSCISSSPRLSNRASFKTHFQVLASDAFLAYGYFSIVKQYGWSNVAIITQEEALFTYVIDLLTELLRESNITYTNTRFHSFAGVGSLRGRLFDPEARIFLLSMYTGQARELLCLAYEAGVYYPHYQFVLVGWYGPGFWVGSQATQDYLLSTYGCTVENRETALAYGISIVQDEFASNYSKVVDSGITANEYYRRYDEVLERTFHDIESFIYGQQCYDATWVLARALNSTMTALKENSTLNDIFHQFNSQLAPEDEFELHHFTYNNSAMLQSIFGNIEVIDFEGLTLH